MALGYGSGDYICSIHEKKQRSKFSWDYSFKQYSTAHFVTMASSLSYSLGHCRSAEWRTKGHRDSPHTGLCLLCLLYSLLQPLAGLRWGVYLVGFSWLDPLISSVLVRGWGHGHAFTMTSLDLSKVLWSIYSRHSIQIISKTYRHLSLPGLVRPFPSSRIMPAPPSIQITF